MYNYFMLIGFVVNDLELRTVADGKKVVNIRLAVRREFQNSNGEYEADYVNISLWDFIAEHEDMAVRIPMSAETRLRSFNLANSVNIILFEALRQLGFPGLE